MDNEQGKTNGFSCIFQTCLTTKEHLSNCFFSLSFCSRSSFLRQELFVFANVTASGGNGDDEDCHQLQEKLAAVRRSWAGQVGLATSQPSLFLLLLGGRRETGRKTVPEGHICLQLLPDSYFYSKFLLLVHRLNLVQLHHQSRIVGFVIGKESCRWQFQGNKWLWRGNRVICTECSIGQLSSKFANFPLFCLG